MPSAKPAARPRLVVIDAANTLYRAFFALPPLRNSSGQPTNSVYGFVTMLQKVIREEAPDHLVVVFDAPGGSFRQRLYPAYKATREAQPEDLSAQFPLAREVVDAYRIPVLQVPDVEADDVIATLVKRGRAEGYHARVITSDKDFLQLAAPDVELFDPMKDRVLDEAYAEFVEPGAYHDGDALGRRHPNLLRLRTFSKIHALAGLRVGYALGAASGEAGE